MWALGLNGENDGIIDYLLSKQLTRLDITVTRHIKKMCLRLQGFNDEDSNKLTIKKYIWTSVHY